MNTIARKMKARRDRHAFDRTQRSTSPSMQRELLTAATRQNIVR